MKLAILGTRGVPPAYGGFETFAAELSTRLVARGHDVTVYCRRARGGGSLEPPSRVDESSSRPVFESSSRRVFESSSRQVDESSSRPVDESSGRQVDETTRGGLGSHSSTTRRLDDSPDDSTGRWRGVRRIVLPAIGHKYLETVSHAFVSALDAFRRDFDAVLVCNAANAFVLPLLRAARLPAAINVDGIERKRRKWNALGRVVYTAGEALSVSFASAVVADADVIASYYREHYDVHPVTIRYGAELADDGDSDVLERLGVEPRGYILYVSRFEPENNPLEVVRAYEKLATAGSSEFLGVPRSSSAGAPRSSEDPRNSKKPKASQPPPLVMVGHGLYAHELVAELHRHASDRILFPGALYGRDYRTLQRNALIYIQATEVGGTHPALIEAMASGGCVVAHDTPENREVGGDAVGYFDFRPAETLSGTLREWLANAALRDDYRARARRRAAERYSWEAVTEAYERLFERLIVGA